MISQVAEQTIVFLELPPEYSENASVTSDIWELPNTLRLTMISITLLMYLGG